MNSSTGSVSLSGMVSLLFASMVIIMTIILSSFVLVKSNVTADVFAQMDSRNRQFEALATHEHIKSYNNTYRKAVDYLKTDSGNEEELKRHLSSAAYFINQDDTTLVERQYYIGLETPNSDVINISTQETEDAHYTVKSIIASPKKKSAVLTTSISK